MSNVSHTLSISHCKKVNTSHGQCTFSRGEWDDIDKAWHSRYYHTSILQYQNTTFRRVHWAFKDRSLISLLGESGPHLCVSVRSEVSDLVTVEPPSWFSSSVNVNVWLRSLITLHLNQRSQLECDSRSESRSLPILRNSKIPAAIFVCLFLREHWCWFTIMKMSLWPVQSSVGGREGGWEGFPFVRLSSLNHCGDI